MRTLYPMLLVLTGGLSYASHAGTGRVTKSSAATSTDCSAEYGRPSICEHVPCAQVYGDFIGTWSGQFYAYERNKSVDGKSVYRPYRNTIEYSQSDCLSNPAIGETFIVGHETDEYPAFEDLPGKIATGLLITGKKADGTPFLRTVGKDGSRDFALVYRNTAAKLAVWRLGIPASDGNPPMTLTTIDGRDYSSPEAETRDVTVTMSVGPAEAAYWEGVIVHGSHTKE